MLNREACRAIQHVFSKLSLVNLISRDAFLVNMSAHVLLNSLMDLGKSDKMRGLSSIKNAFRNVFNQLKNTGAHLSYYDISGVKK